MISEHNIADYTIDHEQIERVGQNIIKEYNKMAADHALRIANSFKAEDEWLQVTLWLDVMEYIQKSEIIGARPKNE